MPIARQPLTLHGPNLAPDAKKCLPRGMTAHGLGSEPVRVEGLARLGVGRLLRLTIALDHRADSRVVVSDANGQLISSCEVRYAGGYQPSDVALPDNVAGPLSMRIEGAPLWVVTGGLADAGVHAWSSDGEDDREAVALALLAEPRCQQNFSWKDGCITDALVDLGRVTGDPRYVAALTRRAHHFVSDGKFRYEDHVNEPRENRFYGIEGGLSVAALMDQPGGELLEALLRQFWDTERTQADGTISDGRHLSTEGNYCVAWPMALMARRASDRALAERACAQLRVRRERMRTGESLWQARNGDEPGRLAGWARAVAWYLLGWARTLAAIHGLKEWDPDLVAEFQRAAAWTQRWQRREGLWGNFIDDATSVVDTSGSAGIATALAWGQALGLLGSDARDAAGRARQGLHQYLIADGWLSGCAQENKGGDALQRGDYRVCAPFGLGLWGQLQAVLRDPGVVHVR